MHRKISSLIREIIYSEIISYNYVRFVSVYRCLSVLKQTHNQECIEGPKAY